MEREHVSVRTSQDMVDGREHRRAKGEMVPGHTFLDWGRRRERGRVVQVSRWLGTEAALAFRARRDAGDGTGHGSRMKFEVLATERMVKTGAVLTAVQLGVWLVRVGGGGDVEGGEACLGRSDDWGCGHGSSGRRSKRAGGLGAGGGAGAGEEREHAGDG